MRVSFPLSAEASSRGARLAVLVGTVASLLFLIVIVSGGFLIVTGPIRLSVRRWPGPLTVSLASWGLGYLLCGRQALASAAAEVLPFIERHAVAIVLVLAASSAGIGVALGTYAASGSDAAGYVSQARMFSSGRVSFVEPLISQVAWPDAPWAFSTLGYRPGVGPDELVPTYPPGLPLVMSAFAGLGPDAVFFVVPAFGAIAVCGAYAVGRRVHSAAAGIGAAALLATSPIFLFQIVQPMSDVAATAWWAMATIFAMSVAPNAGLAAGAAAGLAVLTRPNLAPLGAVVILMLAVTQRSWVGVLRFAIGLCPSIGALLFLQSRLYGSPFASGYGEVSSLFAWSNVLPNVEAYTWRLVRGEPASLLLLISVVLVLVVARVRAVPWPSGGLGRVVLLGSVTAAVVLACYLPYGQFTEWFYLRFFLPAFPAAFALVSAVTLSALAFLPPAARGVAFAAVLTLVATSNIVTADREQAFHLHLFEARYRLAGQYLAASLPANAVVVSAQESASALYYTPFPVVRWDLIATSLDTVVADLRAARRTAVLVIEDWEVPALRARFPLSTLAKLERSPRAEVVGTTRVGIFELTGNEAPAEASPPDGVSSSRAPDLLSYGPGAGLDRAQPAPPWPER